MARLIKTEYVNDMFVYEYELSDEQLELYKEDEDAFWEEYGDDVEDSWDLIRDKAGSPDVEIEFEED